MVLAEAVNSIATAAVEVSPEEQRRPFFRGKWRAESAFEVTSASAASVVVTHVVRAQRGCLYSAFSLILVSCSTASRLLLHCKDFPCQILAKSILLTVILLQPQPVFQCFDDCMRTNFSKKRQTFSYDRQVVNSSKRHLFWKNESNVKCISTFQCLQIEFYLKKTMSIWKMIKMITISDLKKCAVLVELMSCVFPAATGPWREQLPLLDTNQP